MEMFVSDRQLNLDLGPGFMPGMPIDTVEQVGLDGPLALLKPDTDPGWIEEILNSWDNLDALKDHLELMYGDLRNNEGLLGSKQNDLQESLVHGLRDSIRVVGTRIRELEQDQ